MENKLTQGDIIELRKPFKPSQHKFNYDGFPYIDELYVCMRLDEVDPAWTLEILDEHVREPFRTGGNVVARCTVRLTVKGSSRDGTGQTQVQFLKNKVNKVTKEITEHLDMIETNEAEKGAATDAFRRAARLFGIGRYLLAGPDSAKNPNGLAHWLASFETDDKTDDDSSPEGLNDAPPEIQEAQPPPAPVTPATAHQALTGNANGSQSRRSPYSKFEHQFADWDPANYGTFWKAITSLFDHENHRNNALNKMFVDGELTGMLNVTDAIAAVVANRKAAALRETG